MVDNPYPGVALHSGWRIISADRVGTAAMRALTIIFLALFAGACDQDVGVTGSTNSCATNLYPTLDRKNMSQCVDVCLQCERGTQATCSTSCSMKGAK
jgi:hypothetical protein